MSLRTCKHQEVLLHEVASDKVLEEKEQELEEEMWMIRKRFVPDAEMSSQGAADNAEKLGARTLVHAPLAICLTCNHACKGEDIENKGKQQDFHKGGQGSHLMCKLPISALVVHAVYFNDKKRWQPFLLTCLLLSTRTSDLGQLTWRFEPVKPFLHAINASSRYCVRYLDCCLLMGKSAFTA